MALREDVVSSAVAFLQDPSVASAPVEKKLEFLRSKNLTQEEVNISIARASDVGQQSQQSPALPQNYPSQRYRAPPQNYNYPINPYGEWQPPPPEPPRRDWRDWFIMATVVGGVGYGLWTLADRYVKPLIAPPTPPQLEQDKAAIDEQFNKAFALIDTLSSDTMALKEAEEQRTQRLDTAITDIESVVAQLRTASQRREDDARRMEADIKSLRESLPKAIEAVEKASEKQLKELSTELGSLKMLVGNRMGGSTSTNFPSTSAHTSSSRSVLDSLSNSRSSPSTPGAESEPLPANASNSTGVNGVGTQSPFSTPPPKFPAPKFPTYASQAAVSSNIPARPQSTSSSFGAAGAKAAIPAWQMAARNSSMAKDSPSITTADSATNGDGAEAVAALAAN